MSDNLKQRAINGPQLRTRKPTGVVPWPLVLIEGGEKGGKSWCAAEFSASSLVGTTYWLDVDEGGADEYGAIPGVRYEVVEHDGSWPQIFEAVEAVYAEATRVAATQEPPVVLVIDSMTAVWTLLKDWAYSRARKTKFNEQKLQADPNAEIDISMNFWNDSNARHRRLMDLLKTFPGIVVMIARGKETAALDANGRPIPKQSDYKVEGQKDLAFEATAWVRMHRGEEPKIVGIRSVHYDTRELKVVKPGGDQKLRDFSLENLVFKIMKCDPNTAQPRNLQVLQSDEGKAQANNLRDCAVTAADREELRKLWGEAGRLGIIDIAVENESGDDELLGALIKRIGDEMPESS